MIIRERNIENSVEYKYEDGVLVSKTEVFNNVDYNEVVDQMKSLIGKNLIDYMAGVEVTKEIEDECVELLRDDLNIEDCEGYLALVMCFKPFDLNLLKNYSLDEILNRKVSRRNYRGIISRLLGIDIYEDFHSEIDKNNAITLVEAVHYILEEFEGYVDTEEVIPTLKAIYGEDIDLEVNVLLQNESDMETILTEYIGGSITAYNNGVLYEEEQIIYPYLRSMSEVLFQELVEQELISDSIVNDMLHEMTYKDLFYMIYRILVFRPE